MHSLSYLYKSIARNLIRFMRCFYTWDMFDIHVKCTTTPSLSRQLYFQFKTFVFCLDCGLDEPADQVSPTQPRQQGDGQGAYRLNRECGQGQNRQLQP